MNKRTTPDSIKEIWFSISLSFKKIAFFLITQRCNLEMKNAQSASEMVAI